MRAIGDERGQATVEWAGLVLALALVLGALAKLDPGDGERLGTTLLDALTCAAAGGCHAKPDRVGRGPKAGGAGRDSKAGRAGRAPGRRPEDQFTAPPLVPLDPRRSRGSPGALRRSLDRLRDAVVRVNTPRTRRAAGRLWRRAWIACFAYERFRLNRLFPDTVLPGRTVPPREAVRVVNDCLSPVDLVRDFGHRLPP